MKAQLQSVLQRIDELSLRERILLFAAVLTVIFIVWFQALMEPQARYQKQIVADIEQSRVKLAKLQKQIQQIALRATADPDAAIKQRLAALRKRHREMDQQLRQLTVGLIPPREIPDLLQTVLSQFPGLKVEALYSLQPQAILTADDMQAENNAEKLDLPNIYRHGVVLEFTGGYAATLDYLKRLEGMDWVLYWDAIDYNVDEYPRARIRMTVYTLSLDKEWIGV